jgi:rod shape-determining protein MreC
VDVVVQRTGARGFISGTGDERKYTCKVQYMERTDEVEVGDLLVTSGVGRRFPKGIPVATVTHVVKRDFGMYQEVVATPTVDFSRLEEVLIVTSVPPEESAPTAGPKR